MFVYLMFTIFLLLATRAPLFRFLSLLFSGSIIAGILIGQSLDIFDAETNINSFFSVFIIFMCFWGFNVKPALITMKFSISEGNYKLIKAVIFLSCIALAVNIYVVLNSIINILANGLLVSEFKNSGHGKEFVANNFQSLVASFSFIISPLSYLCLASHFYFLIIANRKMAFWGFIGSLNIAMLPLIYFARGGIVIFVLLYFSMLCFVYDYLSVAGKKKVKFKVLLAMAPLIFVFLLISMNRFENYSYLNDVSIISNPVLYSIFDYLSQWLVNGNYLLSNFDTSKIMYASNFTYIPGKLLSPFGVSFAEIQSLRELYFGSRANNFNGLPALMVYDLGYSISIFIVFLFMLFVRFSLKKKECILVKLFWLSVMLPIPLFFFQGLFTIFGFYNLAVLYVAFFSILLKLRWYKS